MRRDHHPLVYQLVRFGLPLVVAVYYITASRGFVYTADAAYGAASWAGAFLGGSPFSADPTPLAPLWSLFIALGGVFRIDFLLTAKVLSLLFCSIAVLGAYLLAVELLDDRIFAFGAALVVALDPWLLQAGPSGGPHGLLLALVTGTLFFLGRGEYALASLFAGLGAGVALPAAGLLVTILVEIWTSGRVRNPRRLSAASIVVFAAVQAPWWIFAQLRSLPAAGLYWQPVLAISWPSALAALVLGALALAGTLVLRRSPLLRAWVGHGWTSSWVWLGWCIVVGIVWVNDFWLLGMPLLLIIALNGLRMVIPSLRFDPPNYTFLFAVVAVFLIVNQILFFTTTTDAMARTLGDEQEVRMAAGWLKENAHGKSVGSEYPALLGTLLGPGARVTPFRAPGDAEFVLAGMAEVGGYHEVYRPAPVDVTERRVGRLAIFQRNSEEPGP